VDVDSDDAGEALRKAISAD
jgi:hypothetical protein